MTMLSSNLSPGIPMREKLKNTYFIIFGPRVNRCILVASLVLFVLSIVHSSSVLSWWYHAAEGILTALFASEISLRLVVMRTGFWESSLNICEAVTCVLCVSIFFILHFSRAPELLVEHQVLIALRYVGQLLRTAGLLAAEGKINSFPTDNRILLFSQIRPSRPLNDERESYRDTL